MSCPMFDKSVAVQRVTAGAGSTEEYGSHIADLRCHIQPFDDAPSEGERGQMGKEWLMFSEVDDIIEGDRIVDGDTVYDVMSVESYNFLGEDRHLEARIRKQA